MFPSTSEEDYEGWTPPEHEHSFVDDTTVKAAVREEDGVMRYHLIRRCVQCDASVAERTSEVAQPIGIPGRRR